MRLAQRSRTCRVGHACGHCVPQAAVCWSHLLPPPHSLRPGLCSPCSQAYYRGAKAALGLRKYDTCEELCRKGLALDPANKELQKYLGQVRAARRPAGCLYMRGRGEMLSSAGSGMQLLRGGMACGCQHW